MTNRHDRYLVRARGIRHILFSHPAFRRVPLFAGMALATGMVLASGNRPANALSPYARPVSRPVPTERYTPIRLRAIDDTPSRRTTESNRSSPVVPVSATASPVSAIRSELGVQLGASAPLAAPSSARVAPSSLFTLNNGTALARLIATLAPSLRSTATLGWDTLRSLMPTNPAVDPRTLLTTMGASVFLLLLIALGLRRRSPTDAGALVQSVRADGAAASSLLDARDALLWDLRIRPGNVPATREEIIAASLAIHGRNPSPLDTARLTGQTVNEVLRLLRLNGNLPTPTPDALRAEGLTLITRADAPLLFDALRTTLHPADLLATTDPQTLVLSPLFAQAQKTTNPSTLLLNHLKTKPQGEPPTRDDIMLAFLATQGRAPHPHDTAIFTNPAVTRSSLITALTPAARADLLWDLRTRPGNVPATRAELDLVFLSLHARHPTALEAAMLAGQTLNETLRLVRLAGNLPTPAPAALRAEGLTLVTRADVGDPLFDALRTRLHPADFIATTDQDTFVLLPSYVAAAGVVAASPSSSSSSSSVVPSPSSLASTLALHHLRSQPQNEPPTRDDIMLAFLATQGRNPAPYDLAIFQSLGITRAILHASLTREVNSGAEHPILWDLRIRPGNVPATSEEISLTYFSLHARAPTPLEVARLTGQTLNETIRLVRLNGNLPTPTPEALRAQGLNLITRAGAPLLFDTLKTTIHPADLMETTDADTLVLFPSFAQAQRTADPATLLLNHLATKPQNEPPTRDDIMLAFLATQGRVPHPHDTAIFTNPAVTRSSLITALTNGVALHRATPDTARAEGLTMIPTARLAEARARIHPADLLETTDPTTVFLRSWVPLASVAWVFAPEPSPVVPPPAPPSAGSAPIVHPAPVALHIPPVTETPAPAALPTIAFDLAGVSTGGTSAAVPSVPAPTPAAPASSIPPPPTPPRFFYSTDGDRVNAETGASIGSTEWDVHWSGRTIEVPSPTDTTGAVTGGVGVPALGTYIPDPALLTLYIEAELLRIPGSPRIYTKPGIPLKTLPPVPVGAYIPEPALLELYRADERIRMADGRIFTVPGIPLRSFPSDDALAAARSRARRSAYTRPVAQSVPTTIYTPITLAPIDASSPSPTEPRSDGFRLIPPLGAYLSDPALLSLYREDEIFRFRDGRIATVRGVPWRTPLTAETPRPSSLGIPVGSYLYHPLLLALYTEAELVRLPDGRMFTNPGIPLRTAPWTPAIPVGEKIPDASLLRFYLEDEIVRLPNGEIYTRPEIPLRGVPPPASVAVMDAAGDAEERADARATATITDILAEHPEAEICGIPPAVRFSLSVAGLPAHLQDALTAIVRSGGEISADRLRALFAGAAETAALATQPLPVRLTLAALDLLSPEQKAQALHQALLGPWNGGERTALGSLVETGVEFIPTLPSARNFLFGMTHPDEMSTAATMVEGITMIPIAGTILKIPKGAFNIVKTVRRATGIATTLRRALSRVTDLRSGIIEARTIAPPGRALTLPGDKAVGREWFDGMTTGWTEEVETILSTGEKILTRTSPDGLTKVNYRIISTHPAEAPFTRIEATIDVRLHESARDRFRDVLHGEKALEIKFAQ